MELENIIHSRKKTIIFEDKNLRERMAIEMSDTNIDMCMDILAKFLEEIIVISRNTKKIQIYEIAIQNNVTIDFVSVTSLREKEVNLDAFKDKIILFDKCFDGMTSKNNNTYQNIKQISDISKKFIAIDNIGENFMYPNYFPTMLDLFNVNINIEEENQRSLNELLLDNFYILNKGRIITEIEKNYWANGYLYNQHSPFENHLKEKIKLDRNINSNINNQNTKVKVNKYIYIFLALFLGMFGVHKFYEKKYLAGTLYLLFCWTYIPFIFAIIELIRAIGINTDENGKIIL